MGDVAFPGEGYVPWKRRNIPTKEPVIGLGLVESCSPGFRSLEACRLLFPVPIVFFEKRREIACFHVVK